MKNFSICSTESTTKVIQILLIILRLRKIFFNRGIFIPMKTKASLKFRHKRGAGHENLSYSDSPFLLPRRVASRYGYLRVQTIGQPLQTLRCLLHAVFEHVAYHSDK